jgi:hypothetical protein
VKWFLAIFTNLVVAALVAVICLSASQVAAQADVAPYTTGYEQGFQVGYAQGYSIAAAGSEKSQPVEPEAIAEVPVDKPQLTEFASLEELQDWLAKDDIDEYVYLFADDDGVARPSDRSTVMTTLWSCNIVPPPVVSCSRPPSLTSLPDRT